METDAGWATNTCIMHGWCTPNPRCVTFCRSRGGEGEGGYSSIEPPQEDTERHTEGDTCRHMHSPAEQFPLQNLASRIQGAAGNDANAWWLARWGWELEVPSDRVTSAGAKATVAAAHRTVAGFLPLLLAVHLGRTVIRKSVKTGCMGCVVERRGHATYLDKEAHMISPILARLGTTAARGRGFVWASQLFVIHFHHFGSEEGKRGRDAG